MDKYVSVGSRRIRYTRDGSGPNVILIHGLGAAIEWWKANIPVLQQHFTVYALDLPGFGMSDRINQDIDIEFFSQFMAQFMEAMEIDSAGLVGHSMGGYIATRTTIDYPDKIDSLVLVNSGGFGRINNTLMKALNLPFIDKIMGLPMKLGIRLLLKSLVYDGKSITPDIIDTAYRHAQRPGANADILRILRTGDAFSENSRQMFTADEIGSISIPAMVIWGSHDSCFPASQGKYAHSLLPEGPLHIFDKCGHMPQLEHPARFNDLLLRFLLTPAVGPTHKKSRD